MRAEDLLAIIGSEFYTGVPDSQLRALCDCLMDKYGIDPKHHVICANEGNSVALGAGYYLATTKIPVIYMQNSGEGNIVNPVTSLTNNNVYAIPQIFIVGWRGEPGVHDEPQHVYQGRITVKLLEDLDINTFVISQETTIEELKSVMKDFKEQLEKGMSVAFIIKKGALTYDNKISYKNENSMKREEIIEHIVKYSKNDPIVSTTGKASRELYEIRNRNNEGHQYDFLTVGSMGHSSTIALGIALNKPNKKVWCIDGDGAALMHMGAMAVIGANKPKNLIHIVINNSAHETVGGMPTVAKDIDIVSIAKACGYSHTICVSSFEEFDKELSFCKNNQALSLIEVKCAIGARSDLGRPKEKPFENKKMFMNNLQGGN
jgi:phosphonopyruvate decarboxylase